MNEYSHNQDEANPPHDLLTQAHRTSQKALISGALHPFDSYHLWLYDHGLPFLVHVAPKLAEKADATRRQRENTQFIDPFLPYDPELFVADISATHVCLLNKYNIYPEHLLIVTRAFEEQTSWLTIADFEALSYCLYEINGLGFYNSGKKAGASQPHKHLQLVPLPMAPEGPFLPLEEAWQTAVFTANGLGNIPYFNFDHALMRLRFNAKRTSAAWAEELYGRYLELLRAMKLLETAVPEPDTSPLPYNLLATRRWLLLVPRSQSKAQGFPINALGFAGSLVARREEDVARYRTVGPLVVLREAACTSQPE